MWNFQNMIVGFPIVSTTLSLACLPLIGTGVVMMFVSFVHLKMRSLYFWYDLTANLLMDAVLLFVPGHFYYLMSQKFDDVPD